jgi:cobalt-zinc-cadmium efflux system outer membrane protein
MMGFRFPVLMALMAAPLFAVDAPTPVTGTVLAITLDDAEKAFLENNLDLLAGKYGIEVAEARKLQAELWPNPNFQIGQNIYNPSTGKYFDFTPSGNTDFQISQLVKLASKQGRQIQVADYEKSISQQQFYDLLRTLKFQLRTTFYRVFWQSRSIQFFDHSLASLKKTIESAEMAYKKRAILLSEVLRLKSLYTQLQGDWLAATADLSSAQADLKTLLFKEVSEMTIEPKVDVEALRRLRVEKSFDELLAVAKDHRPDLKIAELGVQKEAANLSLQHALAFPDLTVNLQYSRAGSYIPEYFALGVGIDLPLFNRNQGGIREAGAQLNLKQALNRKALMDLRHDLEATYHRAQDTDGIVRHIDPNFVKDYDSLVGQMIHNYQNRNIGIIAFADFYESYRNAMLQYHGMQLRRLSAFEELNMGVGTSVVTAQESK